MDWEDMDSNDPESQSPQANSLEPKQPRPKRSGQRRSAIEIASMARAHTATVINMLVGMVAREDVSPTVRINAGLALLDRGWGKPLQKVELEGDRATQITKIVNYIVDPKDPVSPVRVIGANGEELPVLEASEAMLAPEESDPESEES